MILLKYGLVAAVFCLCTVGYVGGVKATNPTVYSSSYLLLPADIQRKAGDLFKNLNLACIGLERKVFYNDYKGYIYLLYKGLVNNPNVLTITDFSQSSTNKWLYAIDLANRKVVYNTFVSHGKNNGIEMVTSFSNLKDSYKSTAGFMLMDDTYKGSYGCSLRFNGMKPGINNRTRNRDVITMHGNRYVNKDKADDKGRVGNSLGCPAVPMSECREIIDFIKEGTVYYIHTPDEFYNETSAILNGALVSCYC